MSLCDVELFKNGRLLRFTALVRERVMSLVHCRMRTAIFFAEADVRKLLVKSPKVYQQQAFPVILSASFPQSRPCYFAARRGCNDRTPKAAKMLSNMPASPELAPPGLNRPNHATTASPSHAITNPTSPNHTKPRLPCHTSPRRTTPHPDSPDHACPAATCDT